MEENGGFFVVITDSSMMSISSERSYLEPELTVK